MEVALEGGIEAGREAARAAATEAMAPKEKKARACSYCHEIGHRYHNKNVITCPKKLKETGVQGGNSETNYASDQYLSRRSCIS